MMKWSSYIVFTLICLFIALTSYQLYKYYEDVKDVEEFIGLKSSVKAQEIFKPLLNKFCDNRIQVLNIMPDKYEPDRCRIDRNFFDPSDESKGDWIAYSDAPARQVHYTG